MIFLLSFIYITFLILKNWFSTLLFSLSFVGQFHFCGYLSPFLVIQSPGIPGTASLRYLRHFKSGMSLTPITITSLPLNTNVHFKMATKSVLSINPYAPVFSFPFWIWFLLGTADRHKFPGASVTPTAPTLSETIHMTTNMGQNPPRGLPVLLTRPCSLLVKPGFYRSSI